jgi:hypothetical protein
MSAMRKLVLIAVLCVATLLVAGAAQAANPLRSMKIQGLSQGGNVPQSMLAEMGLEGMEVISDQQGTEVRGQGFYFFVVGVYHHNHFHPFLLFPQHVPPFFFYHLAQHGYFVYPYVW